MAKLVRLAALAALAAALLPGWPPAEARDARNTFSFKDVSVGWYYVQKAGVQVVGLRCKGQIVCPAVIPPATSVYVRIDGVIDSNGNSPEDYGYTVEDSESQSYPWTGAQTTNWDLLAHLALNGTIVNWPPGVYYVGLRGYYHSPETATSAYWWYMVTVENP